MGRAGLGGAGVSRGIRGGGRCVLAAAWRGIFELS